MEDKIALGIYRDFRRKILDEITSPQDAPMQSRFRLETHQRGFKAGRQLISAFRKSVAEQGITLLQTSPEYDWLLRRVLRISPKISLRTDTLASVARIALRVMPMSLTGHRAQRLLRQCGTFEGRKFLFMHLIQPIINQPYYNHALDFSLRHFEPIRSKKDFDSFDFMDDNLPKVAYKLGLRTANEVRAALPRDPQRQQGHLLLLLVSEGVIQKIDELPWAGSSSLWYDRDQNSDKEMLALRDTVRCLLTHGVDREQIASIVRFPLWTMNPGSLSQNLDFLKNAGVGDLTNMLKQVGNRLWSTPTTTWRYVVETIGARSPSEIARFKRLLDCDHPLSEEFVQELFSLGAMLDDLVACQRLLTDIKPDNDGISKIIDNLRLLAAPPHKLSVGQISTCLPYLNGGNHLPTFLTVLDSHGFGSAQAVLEFQRCFRKVTIDSLNNMLTILDNRGKGESLANITFWALNACQGNYFEAYKYLISACIMDGINSLQQALKLVPLGTPFLRYLVEVRRLVSLKEIRMWYRNAIGIVGYQSWRAFDTLDLDLVDDAFTRNQFNNLNANQDVVRIIVQDRVNQQLGPWPWSSDEAAKDDYREKGDALARTIRNEIRPSIMPILSRTGGVLLSTLFEVEVGGVLCLDDKLSRFVPLLDNLMKGLGPSGETLSALEVDAIALVYRTPAETIRSIWPKIQGRESDIQQLNFRPYPMVWSQAQCNLRKKLQTSGFFSLLKAARFAQGFRSDAYQDMLTACKRLSPKHLRPGQNAPDLESMALHLGSLLAMVQCHDGIGKWISGGFDELIKMDHDSLDAYQRVSGLVDLFNEVLPEALDTHAEGYIKKLRPVDAAHWAERLGPCDNTKTGHDQLLAMLTQTRLKALPLYLKWASRQFDCYDASGDTNLKSRSLTAFVSKHPAAFFAKSAVQLCTAGNVEMWNEERLFHLTVFDPIGRHFAGMALIYIQELPELDRMRRSLIIRAINPTDEMLAGHAVDSIVESFLDIAIQIAEDNKLGCVAFPALSGMHLMSNRAPIENYLKERYVARASHKKLSVSGNMSISLRDTPQEVQGTFYAYESGQMQVQSLFVIWQASGGTGVASQTRLRYETR